MELSLEFEITLPPEVYEHVRWLCSDPFDSTKGRPPTAVKCYEKATIGRGAAWDLVWDCTPESLAGDKKNPWRKCHTQHYWAWFYRAPKEK